MLRDGLGAFHCAAASWRRLLRTQWRHTCAAGGGRLTGSARHFLAGGDNHPIADNKPVNFYILDVSGTLTAPGADPADKNGETTPATAVF